MNERVYSRHNAAVCVCVCVCVFCQASRHSWVWPSVPCVWGLPEGEGRTNEYWRCCEAVSSGMWTHSPTLTRAWMSWIKWKNQLSQVCGSVRQTMWRGKLSVMEKESDCGEGMEEWVRLRKDWVPRGKAKCCGPRVSLSAFLGVLVALRTDSFDLPPKALHLNVKQVVSYSALKKF